MSRILVVDDESQLLRALRINLRARSYLDELLKRCPAGSRRCT
jgi:hypothetical protein